MPTIFIENNNQYTYSVDYDQLFVDSITIAKNPLKKQIKIELLINQLRQLDIKNVRYVQIGECFYHKFSLGSNTLYISFNIDLILNRIAKSNYTINTLCLSNFGIKSNSKIIYKREVYENTHISSSKPILLCPFKLNGSEYLVIDGNHRVTAKIDNGIDKIKCYIYNINKDRYQYSLSSLYDLTLYSLVTLIHQ